MWRFHNVEMCGQLLECPVVEGYPGFGTPVAPRDQPGLVHLFQVVAQRPFVHPRLCRQRIKSETALSLTGENIGNEHASLMRKRCESIREFLPSGFG